MTSFYSVFNSLVKQKNIKINNSNNCKALITELTRNFNELVEFYLQFSESSLAEYEKSYKVNSKIFFKAWIGVLYLYLLKIPISVKYFFETYRHNEIIETFDPKEIMIMGGLNIQGQARMRKNNFLWTGGIVAAIIIAAKKNKPEALVFQIKILAKKLSKSKFYFLLYEDTTPEGFFFANFGNTYYHPTIHIQHGTTAASVYKVINGDKSKYNILYSILQKEVLNNQNTIAFELGPPFDIVPIAEVSKEIVLVGSGEEFEPYFKSLEIYAFLEMKLKKAGWDVYYRPHYCENKSDYINKFSKIEMCPKNELLSNSLKIFIGINSTLLFEAQSFGHCIITLKDPLFPLYLFESDFQIEVSRIEEIDYYIGVAYKNLLNKEVNKPLRLKERFTPILKKIEELEIANCISVDSASLN